MTTALAAARERLEASVHNWLAQPKVSAKMQTRREETLRRLEDELVMAVRRETTAF